MNDPITTADSPVTPIMDGVSTPTSTMSEEAADAYYKATPSSTVSESRMATNYLDEPTVSGQDAVTYLGAIVMIFWILYVTITSLLAVSQYALSYKFKVKYPWLGAIPLVNLYNLVKIAGHDGWKVILLFIPFVNLLYIAFSLNPAIARRTGHGVWTSVGLFFLFPIVFPIIALNYKGEDETTLPATPPLPPTPQAL